MRISDRARIIVAAVLLLSVGTGTVGTAHAAGAEDAEAESLIARGIELREHHKDDEALAVFKKALARSPSPRARAQVALAEQALGLWVAAEADLSLALSTDSDPWIARNRAALEGALAAVRRRIGTLEVRGTEGADVILDGVRLGALPAPSPYRVEAGRRTLEIRAKGFHATTRSIEVAAGGMARETVMLVAVTADGAGSGQEASTPPAVPAPERDHGDPGQGQRLLGWVFTGTGLALLATGGVGLLVRKGIIDDYNAQCPGLGANQPPACDEKVESSRTWLTVSIVSLVGGGVFALGGLALVATAPRRAASAAAPGGVRVGCAPSSLRGGAAMVCSGSF